MFSLRRYHLFPPRPDPGAFAHAGNGLHPNIRRFIEEEVRLRDCSHCFHESSIRTESGERITVENCCWCGKQQERHERLPGAHGRYVPGASQ
jgi:hypothetical protein